MEHVISTIFAIKIHAPSLALAAMTAISVTSPTRATTVALVPSLLPVILEALVTSTTNAVGSPLVLSPTLANLIVSRTS